MMVFNTHIKKYVGLADGEEFCDICKGKGTVYTDRVKLSYDPYRKDLVCHKCFGTGVLDWIEKAMGKKDNRRTSTAHGLVLAK